MPNTEGWLKQPIPTAMNFTILTILVALDLLLAASPILVSLQWAGLHLGISRGPGVAIASVLALGIALIPMRRLLRAWRYDLHDLLGQAERMGPVR